MNPVCTHNECNPWRNSGATFTCQRVMADPNSTAQGKEQGIFGVKIFLREIFRVILRLKPGLRTTNQGNWLRNQTFTSRDSSQAHPILSHRRR